MIKFKKKEADKRSSHQMIQKPCVDQYISERKKPSKNDSLHRKASFVLCLAISQVDIN